ncbi:MAG: hypothetical protein ACPL7D_07775 [Candidatus Sumerlaeaceae bacterium]|jgi:hypothetical protein
MTAKQRQWTRIGVLLLLLVAALVWKGQGFFSEWQGNVTQIVLPDQGPNGYVVVRDDEGRYFRVILPRDQLDRLSVGDRVAKQRFSLVVKLLQHESSETTAPLIKH